MITQLQEIAHCLGPGWTAENRGTEPHYMRYYITHTDGYSIHCYTHSYSKPGMITFSGEYYKDSQGVTNALRNDPECSMSQSRTPNAIAADLQRRLVTQYRKIYDERKCAALKREATYSATNTKAWEVASRMGTEITTEHYFSRGHTTAVNSTGFICMRYDRYEAKLDLSHDEALIIADVMRSFQQTRDAREEQQL